MKQASNGDQGSSAWSDYEKDERVPFSETPFSLFSYVGFIGSVLYSETQMWSSHLLHILAKTASGFLFSIEYQSWKPRSGTSP